MRRRRTLSAAAFAISWPPLAPLIRRQPIRYLARRHYACIFALPLLLMLLPDNITLPLSFRCFRLPPLTPAGR